MDSGAGGREFQRVVEQVGHGLLHQFAVTEQGQVIGDFGVQDQPAFLGNGAVEFVDVAQHGGEVDGGEGGAARAGFDFGDTQQGLEHADNAVQVSMARSIADCRSSVVCACSEASSSRARARAMGVRRSCAMALETWRTPSIRREMRSSMSLMISASS